MNIHIPSCAVSVCCSSVAYCGSGRRLRIDRAVLGDIAAVRRVVLVGRGAHDRRARKVVLWRWRGRQPFEAGGTPRIGACPLAIEQRPAEIKERQRISYGE